MGGEKEGKGEGKGEIPEGFLAWLAERRAKNIICKSAKMKFARTDNVAAETIFAINQKLAFAANKMK